MNIILNVIYYYLSFGSIFALVLAASQILQKPLTKQNILLTFFFVNMSYIILYFGLDNAGYILTHPQYFLSFIPTLYTIGPLFYLYVKVHTTSNFKWKNIYYLHFIPLLLSVLICYPYWILPDQQKIDILNLLYNQHQYDMNIKLIVSTANFLILGYMIAIFLENKSLVDFRNHRIQPILLLLFFYTIATILGMVAVFSNDINNIRFNGAFLTTTLIYFYLVSQRYPNLVNGIAKSIKIKKYEKSLLRNLNINQIENNLLVLMTVEKVFLDETLTLNTLAEKLCISTHQLSQYLNENKKINFPSYINYYRIEEAKELLIKFPQMSIINIAMECGFNSVSVFNTTFLKLTNQSPSLFRKTYQGKVQTITNPVAYMSD